MGVAPSRILGEQSPVLATCGPSSGGHPLPHAWLRNVSVVIPRKRHMTSNVEMFVEMSRGSDTTRIGYT